MHSEAVISEVRRESKVGDARCVLCKGARALCGKQRCPIIVKYHSRARLSPLFDQMGIDGSSPPGVFVGRFGYPKVYVGPLIPPQHGDTALLDTPEHWTGLTIDQIVNFRFSLVRGMHLTHVRALESGGRIVEHTQELAMASQPSEAEAQFERRPYGKLTLDDEVQPFGPSTPIKRLDVGTLRIDHRIDRAHSDTDLRAVEAVQQLYKEGVLVSRVHKAFSVGAFGIKRHRRMVPTRWSITAVDDILGKGLLDRTRTYPLINEFRLYETEALDNRWCVLLLPCTWRYELIEAWYPNTVWNPYGREVLMLADHEGYQSRKEYAQIGGCYYAARLAVNELLERERRQAGAVVLREAHAGYIMPVGVWNVRENVRSALRSHPLLFSSLREALAHVEKRMAIPLRRWIGRSAVLSELVYQRRIEDFLEARDDRFEAMPGG
ncbi:MAG: Nre family DNA repair protein [Candidatus Thermoplasmatota archaeon]